MFRKLTKVLATLFLMVVASRRVTSRADVLGGPITNPSNGHLYYLLSQNNWTGAETEAVTLGGHLATINDASENQWVFDTFAAFDGLNRYMWIGLHDVGTPTTFHWVWSSNEQFVYSNWAQDEPNSYDEHYAYMYPNGAPAGINRTPGKWNNYQDLSSEFSGTTPLLGVAEVVPEPSILALSACGLAILTLAGLRKRPRSTACGPLLSAAFFCE